MGQAKRRKLAGTYPFREGEGPPTRQLMNTAARVKHDVTEEVICERCGATTSAGIGLLCDLLGGELLEGKSCPGLDWLRENASADR